MAALPKNRTMSNDSFRIDKEYKDIIECALNNDFRGVNSALREDKRKINAQRSESGITALIGASSRGLDSMVNHLLAKEGVNLSIQDDYGNDVFDHARPFPLVISALSKHLNLDQRWQEKGIFSVPSP